MDRTSTPEDTVGAVRSEVQKTTVAFDFGRCPTNTRPLPLLVCRCPNAHTAFAALVVVRLNLTRTHPRACVAFRSEDGPNAPTAFAALVVVRVNLKRTHPRACVAFRSEVDWGQHGVAVKASAVGVVRWQTHARRSVRIFTAITFVI